MQWRNVGWLFKYFTLSIILFSAFLAHADGLGLNPGAIGTTPGPLKCHDLILIKEKVVATKHDEFKLEVNADFWVSNPTDKDIEVMMGFPLTITGYRVPRFEHEGDDAKRKGETERTLEDPKDRQA